MLLARGNPALADETLQFYAQSVYGPCVFMSSSSLANGSSGIPVAQGVACLSAPSLHVRGVGSTSSGSLEIGAMGPAGRSIARLSGGAGPGTSDYQVCYRQAALGSWAAAAGNFTNAVAVEWRL